MARNRAPKLYDLERTAWLCSACLAVLALVALAALVLDQAWRSILVGTALGLGTGLLGLILGRAFGRSRVRELEDAPLAPDNVKAAAPVLPVLRVLLASALLFVLLRADGDLAGANAVYLWLLFMALSIARDAHRLRRRQTSGTRLIGSDVFGSPRISYRLPVIADRRPVKSR